MLSVTILNGFILLFVKVADDKFMIFFWVFRKKNEFVMSFFMNCSVRLEILRCSHIGIYRCDQQERVYSELVSSNPSAVILYKVPFIMC